MHVNAVNKVARSFEHIPPGAVGNHQRVLVGELSGGTNVMMKARELGIELEEKSPTTRRILEQIKELENEGYEFEAADASFELVARAHLDPRPPLFQLHEYHVSIRKNRRLGFDLIEATVRVEVDGREVYTVSDGDGPVNALDGALRKALYNFYPEIMDIRLTDYKVRILNSKHGTAARTRVLIESTDGEATWATVGVSDDIVEASWRALRDSMEYKLVRDRLARERATTPPALAEMEVSGPS
jgi:2-isopropylmalate synthase